MSKPKPWKRYRFKTKSTDDNRPLIYNPAYPWWCTGYGDNHDVIVAYLPHDENLSKYWNDAFDIYHSDEEKIIFTSRFTKPDDFVEQTKKDMNALVEGYTYELENFEHKEAEGQTLQFIHKEPDGTNLKTVADGTTNEAVLEALIHRMKYLQAKFPCQENAIVITKLEEALMWLEKRTKDRLKRGVEGKQIQ